MAAGFALLFIQAILIQSVFSQCVNRGVPGCQSNLVEALMPNQVFLREQMIPNSPPAIPAPISPPIIPTEVGYAPTIIQDGSIANSLANALQLLVVSTLLSNTLPGPCTCPACPGFPACSSCQACSQAYPAYPQPYPVETVVSPSPYSYIY